MKRFKTAAVIISLLLVMFLAACGSQTADYTSEPADQQNESSQAAEDVNKEDANKEKNEQGEKTSSGKDTLILYFSANNTKDADAVSAATPIIDGESSVEWIAGIIGETTGGKVIPIVPSKDYPLEYDELADAAKEETDSEARPAFEDLGADPSSYKTVFIGYPMWWYTTPMTIETLFEKYDFDGATIIPFNTHEGSDDGGTYELIKEWEPGATVLEGIAVEGDDAGSDSAEKDVREWLEGLGYKTATEEAE